MTVAMAVSKLPIELLQQIVLYLDTRDAQAMCATNRHLYAALRDLALECHIRHMPNASQPLWWAIQNCDLALATRALKAGADPNEFMSDSRFHVDPWSPPLLVAIYERDLAMVKLLLRHGASPACANRKHTALTLAAREGQLGIVKALLDTSAAEIIINNYSCQAMTALHDAAGANHVSVCQLLLERGAKLEARNYAGNTPLLHAIHEGASDTIDCLLAAGANIHNKSYSNVDSLGLAIWTYVIRENDDRRRQNLRKLFDLHIKQGMRWERFLEEGESYVHFLLADFDLPIVRSLLEVGVPADLYTAEETPLWSCMFGSGMTSFRPLDTDKMERERLLIEYGAQVNFADMRHGRTILMGAVETHTPAAIRYLLDKGASPFVEDVSGVNALGYAVRSGRQDIVSLLQKHMASHPET